MRALVLGGLLLCLCASSYAYGHSQTFRLRPGSHDELMVTLDKENGHFCRFRYLVHVDHGKYGEDWILYILHEGDDLSCSVYRPSMTSSLHFQHFELEMGGDSSIQSAKVYGEEGALVPSAGSYFIDGNRVTNVAGWPGSLVRVVAHKTVAAVSPDTEAELHEEIHRRRQETKEEL